MLPGPYNNYMQLFQFKDHVIIFNEMIHDARVVPTDGRPHLRPRCGDISGDSVGRWEGTRWSSTRPTSPTRRTSAAPATACTWSSDSRALDADTLLYEFTVDDPSSFTRPWTAAVPMKRTDEQLFEYACHEGNEAMVGILGGAQVRGEEPEN